MKVASFKNHDGQIRIGMEMQGKLADLTAGLEKFLVEEAGIELHRAREVAMERLPLSMFDLIRREKEGQADLKLAGDFTSQLAKKADVLFSPTGDKIIYGLEEVSLLMPIQNMSGRVFNMEYNYPAYQTVYNTDPPNEGETAMFMMEPETIIGPDDFVKWPTTANEVTAAVELGIIIGKSGKRIPQAKASEYIFGYTVVTDFTGMSILRGLGPGKNAFPKAFYFTRAMIMDTFQPVGPYIALQDEIPSPQKLEGELKVNGRVVSKGSTADMRVSAAGLIEFLSRDITLEAGDLISTGAIGTTEYPPEAGVTIGDVTEATIEHIGTLRNTVAA